MYTAICSFVQPITWDHTYRIHPVVFHVSPACSPNSDRSKLTLDVKVNG